MPTDFEEVAHSGGKITFRILTDDKGRRGYEQSFSGSRPVPMVMIGLHALLAQGIPVASARFPGLGGQTEPAPFPGCVFVMVASDSHGKFGHYCQSCEGYWRSGPSPNFCPYCRHQDEPHQFLSLAQRRYVAHYCEVLGNALASEQDGEFIIDMDEVADAVGQEGERPAFYVSEESQQHKFQCASCGEFNDVIGRFAYCSKCASRNDAAIFKSDIERLRGQVNIDNTGSVLRDAISAFDSVVGMFAKQLLMLVPLSKRRAERLERGRFHDLEVIDEILSWFDIDPFKGLSGSDRAFLIRQFWRRHVYEHHGGEVDAHYLEKSGDTTVRLKQHLSETIEDMHRLLGGLDRLIRNIHEGFHELIPPLSGPIDNNSAKGGSPS